jgi:TolA-binding protein
MSSRIIGKRSKRWKQPSPGLAAALAAALLLLVGAGAARAAEPGDAKARYLSGQSHYNLNEFAEALQDFKEAYRLRPDPAFLFNIAQCERQLGNLEEAIKFYRSYLRNKPETDNKREIEKKIEELKGLVEAKKKATTGAPQSVMPPATVDDATSGRGSSSARAGDADRAPASPPPPATPATSEPAAPAPPAAATPTGAAPPPAAEPAATTATPGADLTARPADAAAGGAAPIYRKWWFWAGAGALVVGLGVLAAVALSGGSSPPASELGTRKVF